MSATTDRIIEQQSKAPVIPLSPKKGACKRCGGLGFIPDSRLPHCPKCGGDGKAA